MTTTYIESFFGTLKAEYFYVPKVESIEALEAGVNNYIDYYNNERIKLGLQGLSPVEYRRITMSNFWGSVQTQGDSSVY